MYLATLSSELGTLGELLAALLGVLAVVAIIGFIFYILMVIAGWRILKKAGESGWKILIPIYNIYMLWKIAGMKNWFWSVICSGIIVGILEAIAGVDYGNFYDESVVFDNRPMVIIATLAGIIYAIYVCVAQINYAYRTSKVFGHGLGYTIGIILLPNLFWLILGFGSSTYDKRRLNPNAATKSSTSRSTAKSSSKSSTKKK